MTVSVRNCLEDRYAVLPSWPICIIVGNPGSMLSLQRVAQHELRNRLAIEPVVFIGGEAERPFGEARFAQGVDKECQVFAIAKVRPFDPDCCKGSIVGRDFDAFSHRGASVSEFDRRARRPRQAQPGY